MDYGSLIEGGFGIIGSGLNYLYQKKLAAQQNQYNIDMWKMQNEYNSPAAQMKRFEEAGLNPGLMYGQVTPGNASSAPQMVTPEAPQLSRDMRELAKAFNIEGLKQAIAETRIKQAEARQASAVADRTEGENSALSDLYWDYSFDPATGQFVYDGGVASRNGDNLTSKDVYNRPGSIGRARLMQYLSDNFRTNALLVPRANLIGSQRYLNTQRSLYLAPQIGIANYEYQYRKPAFWIGQAGRVLGTVSKFLPYSPLKFK